MFEDAMNDLQQPQAVSLRRLATQDAQALYDLVQGNVRHLSEFGDYAVEITRSVAEWQEHLEQLPDGELALGMTKQGNLIGCVSLICYQPSVFGLGYWISAAHTGRGYITQASGALIEYADRCLAATEIWAGIKAENVASIAVAKKLGMSLARQQPSHLSYVLRLNRSVK